MGRTTKEQLLPRARQDRLLQERVDDEIVVYDLESKNVHCLSPLAAAVFERCDGSTSVAECAALTGASPDEIRETVAQLRDHSLLELPAIVVSDGMSRRGLVRRSALAAGAAAFAAPLISSIVAPTAAMAVSGIPSGCTGCGKNNDCVSNHCCQNIGSKQCNKSCCVAGNNSCKIDAQGNCTSPQSCTGVVCPPGSVTCCSPP